MKEQIIYLLQEILRSLKKTLPTEKKKNLQLFICLEKINKIKLYIWKNMRNILIFQKAT